MDSRSHAPPRISAGSIATTSYLIGIFAFLYLPIFVLILLAFNDSSMTGFPYRGFTLRWFAAILGDAQIVRGLYNSFVVAVQVTLISVLIGTASAFALVQYRFVGRIVFVVLLFLPVVIPKTVLGLAILSVTTYFSIPRTLATVVFAHVLFCVPFVTIIIASVLVRMDGRLIEAAKDLGAGGFRTFVKVVLPLIANGIVAGAFVAFVLSFAEFNLSFFLSGRQQTLPLVLFSQFRFEITPKINALSAAMVGASILLTVVAEYVRTRRTSTAGMSQEAL